MFVSFCLNYAGVRDFPLEASPARWVKTLQDAQIDAWRDTDTYTPLPGDLIFFDLDLNGVADHVGLVETVKNDAASKNEFSLTTIEGNYSNAVKQAKYSMADERILGYGALPENPDLEEAEETGQMQPAEGGQTVSADSGNAASADSGQTGGDRNG